MIARNGNRSDSYNLQPLNVNRDETKVAPVGNITEGESTQVLPETSNTTAIDMKETRREYVATRKVTAVMKNGVGRVVVNRYWTMLAVRHTSTVKLGLQLENRRVTVNFLNGPTDSF